ncbi:MAG: HD domain-containing protein [Pseudobutyrivibrio sp.]|nr:HD domain-containing protein [Pseudobutyrivibrio sp.]
MSFHFKKRKYGILYGYLAVAIGVIINVILGIVVNSILGLPLYLDVTGTVFVAAVAGLLPAVLTGLLTNVIISFIIPNAFYFALLSVMVAIVAAYYARYDKLHNIKGLISYFFILAILGGTLTTLIHYLLLGATQYQAVADFAHTITASSKTGLAFYMGVALINTIIQGMDKALASAVGLALARLVPSKIKSEIYDSGWKQKPISKEEILSSKVLGNKNNLLKKIVFMLVFVATAFVVIISLVSINIYFEDCKEEYSINAMNAATFASEVIDGDRVIDYIKWGEETSDYRNTRDLLQKILKSSQGVHYLYVVRIERNNLIYLFDMDTGEEKGFAPGTVKPIEESFKPYVDQLMKGEEVGTIIGKSDSDMVLTAFAPIKKADGKTVAYACADIYFGYMSKFAQEFLIKTLLIFSGFLILAIQWALSVTGYGLVYPISSITKAARGFIESMGDQKAIDESVRKTRSLDIKTNDEVQELYEVICKMQLEMAEQVRDLRHYADSTSKMQNGLIITMADMVENRDSDTGAHIQKTAAYVRVILNGLKNKGYYAEKLTEKYMADVEMSAPLHDIGKIHISDTILNKPGKLTEEEFEIMKTHTIYGREIMENAIGTVKGENYLKEARNMAAYHHERWDGKGYPEGLHGEVIPLSARIMAVADVFDALTSPRVYKPAFPLEKALAILEEESGKQFDPKCIEAFMDSLTDVKRILKKYNS